jgi:5'-deoxynucleotidase YfbR-like HD superfamily hydrolase
MRLTDLLALSHVPRWVIVPCLRQQTVADHSFRTLIIAMELADRLGVKLKMADIVTVMHHDADESRSGDIPASFKDEVMEEAARNSCSWLEIEDPSISGEALAILHLADKIEALTFISRYGVGNHARRAANGVKADIDAACPGDWFPEVVKLINDIDMDRER